MGDTLSVPCSWNRTIDLDYVSAAAVERKGTDRRRGDAETNIRYFSSTVFHVIRLYLLQYGTGYSIGKLSFVCKDLYRYCFRNEKTTPWIWKGAFFRDFKYAKGRLKTLKEERWLTCYRNEHRRWCKSEINYLRARNDALHALDLYKRTYSDSHRHDIVGAISNLIRFDDDNVARCISLFRPQASNIVVMRSQESVLRFKLSRSNGVPVPFNGISYITLDSDFDCLRTSSGFPSGIDALPDARDEEGFIGYAVRLARLRKQHEYLRSTVLWTIFRNLMVFETSAAGTRYAERHKMDGTVVWTTGLDVKATEKNTTTSSLFAYRGFRPLAGGSRTTKERIESLLAVLSCTMKKE